MFYLRLARLLLAFLLVILVMPTVPHMIPPVKATSFMSSVVASDSEVAASSLAIQGGQKVIVDSYGKHLAVYTDKAGRLGISFANGDPRLEGAWSGPVKSPGALFGYKRPALVSVSANLLHIIAEGGAGSQYLVDTPVSLIRDVAGDIIGVTYGARSVLDSSGNAFYPSALLAHDGSIIVAWNVKEANVSSTVSVLRWTLQAGWRNIYDPNSTTPTNVIVDTSNSNSIFPYLIERPDNYRLYLFGNRAGALSANNLAFNSADYNGVGWSWGVQNLAYEANAAHGIEDAPSMIWDPTRSYVVVAYSISGSTRYGVFTLDSSDQKTHFDTAALAGSSADWGSITIDASTGDYYLFVEDAASEGGSGSLGYARFSSGTWDASLTIIDSATNNVGISVERPSSPGIDILYSKGTVAPVTIQFFSLSTVDLKQTTVSLISSPNPSEVGHSVSISGSLAETAQAIGLSPRTVQIEQSYDLSLWTTVAVAVTGPDGSYAVSRAFPLATTYHLRAVFAGDSSYLGSYSLIGDQKVNGVSSGTFTFAAAGDHDANSHTTDTLDALAESGSSFYLGLGDFSYGTLSPETAWCNYITSHVGPTFPFELISGNHEDGNEEPGQGGLIDNFASCLPDRIGSINGTYAKEYFFDYPVSNPLARIIMISPKLNFTYGGPYTYKVGNPHYTWLANTIDSARASGIPWVIVGMHKPCITIGVSDCEIGTDLMNLLLDKRVDLVLQAHDHTYQRSKQLTCATPNSYDSACVADDGIDGVYRKNAGTVFVIAGLFGAGLTPTNATDPEAPYFTKTFGQGSPGSGRGFMKYTVSASEINAQLVLASGGNFTDNFTLIGSTAPLIDVPGDQTINEGANLTFAVNAVDYDIPAQTITISPLGLPSGASFVSSPGNPASGDLTWTPSEAQGPGDYTITFTATDNGNPPQSVAKTVMIHVNEVNSPPLLIVPGSQTAYETLPLTLTVSATDIDLPAQTITLSASGLPSGSTFNTATGTFSWTPTNGQSGTYIVTFTATDSGVPQLSASSTVTIVVNHALQPVWSKKSPLTWTQTLSFSKAKGTEKWTAKITNPNTGLSLWVNVRIVGVDTTGQIGFTANSGPVQILAGQTATIIVKQVFNSNAIGHTFTFTAYIDYGVDSSQLVGTSAATKTGTFSVVR